MGLGVTVTLFLLIMSLVFNGGWLESVGASLFSKPTKAFSDKFLSLCSCPMCVLSLILLQTYSDQNEALQL